MNYPSGIGLHDSKALEAMVGRTIASVSGLCKFSGKVVVQMKDGARFEFYHSQECCETVSLEDYEYDEKSMIGEVVTSAEEVSGSVDKSDYGDRYFESVSWTFTESTRAKVSCLCVGLASQTATTARALMFTA